MHALCQKLLKTKSTKITVSCNIKGISPPFVFMKMIAENMKNISQYLKYSHYYMIYLLVLHLENIQ